MDKPRLSLALEGEAFRRRQVDHSCLAAETLHELQVLFAVDHMLKNISGVYAVIQNPFQQ